MGAFIDIAVLRAFAVVAGELNMRRAAEALNISQPPLSRKIKNLEDSLGARLFARRSYGLELTDEGRELLGIVLPLLTMQEEAQRKLDKFKKCGNCAVGFTTAFEQSVYGPIIKALKIAHGERVAIKRGSSVQLANDVEKGIIQAAWIALPNNMPNLSIIETPYSENLLAATPEKWGKYDSDIDLIEMNNKPLFWFPARRNPYWHKRMSAIFRSRGFKTRYIEEPLEYEVLLARVAAGEGWALIPESFAVIQRNGVKFIKIRDLPQLRMGIIYGDKVGEKLAIKYREELNKSI